MNTSSAWGTRRRHVKETKTADWFEDENYAWSYCRDFKKEGLTKPREILRVMMEELHLAYPTCKAFLDVGFFDRFRIILEDGSIHEPRRGHGLGMANDLTTLMQIIIESMVRKRTGISPKWSGYVNDDAALSFRNYAEASEYADEDRVVCESLSLIYKSKATFLSPTSIVMCEVYVQKMNPAANVKAVFASESLKNLLKSINPSHARSMANLMNIENVDPEWLYEITDYWGWVLYRNEQSDPDWMGGWWRQIRLGIDVSFWNLKGHVLDLPRSCAFRAYQEVNVEFRPWEKKRKFESKAAQGGCFSKEFLIDADLMTVEDEFRPSVDSAENCRAWKAFEKKLQKTFGFLQSRSWKIRISEAYESVTT